MTSPVSRPTTTRAALRGPWQRVRRLVRRFVGTEGNGPARWRRWRWFAAGGAIAFLLLALRQPLAEWLWPETRAQQLRERAELALRTGRLTAADGSGARELYEAALALDPDRIDAREGLGRVGQAALAQARAAIRQRRFDRARALLALAQELAVPRAQLAEVREQLRKSEAATVGIDDLLRRAAAARAAGRLDGDDQAALPLYQRVLEFEPDLTAALEGREDTLSDLLQQAHTRLRQGDLAGAAALVHRVQAADAGHVELPDALAELVRVAEQQRRRAERDLRRGRLERALAGYRAALAAEPADADSQRGLVEVAKAFARRSERLAADYRFDEARAALGEAQAIAAQAAIDVPAISAAQQHLARAQQAQRRARPELPPAQRRQRVAKLLAEAAEAESRGDLLTPPGESAFDKLRAARALAPQDARVRAAAIRIARAASSCFDDALRGNRLVRAGTCLDARNALEGDSAAVRQGRRELARRWIALGDQLLNAGEVERAKRALSSARALDPGAEGLDAFEGRVRAASLAVGKEGG